MLISRYIKKGWGLLLLLPLLSIHSCKTDFDVIAPYKEITVVYGLIDPAADTQYIKVNKAFLGEGNALMMAKEKNSTNYTPGTLDVKLKRMNFGQVVQTIQLQPTTDIPKDPGIFSSPDQVLYRAVYKPVYDASYKLEIYNNHDEQTLSSSASAVGSIAITDFTHPGPNEPINFTNATAPTYAVQFRSPSNARLFSLVIRFHYTETNISTSQSDEKYIDWDLGTEKAPHLAGGDPITFRFNRADFYGLLRNRLEVNADLVRTMPQKPVEFRITYAGDDLSTYIDVNKPSIGIIQEKPEFSNISNGIGIFSSRSAIYLYRGMDISSIDSLRQGSVTKVLNFQ